MALDEELRMTLEEIKSEATIQFKTRWASEELRESKKKWEELRQLYNQSQKLEYPDNFHGYVWFEYMMNTKYRYSKKWEGWVSVIEPNIHKPTKYEKELEQVFIDHVTGSLEIEQTRESLSKVSYGLDDEPIMLFFDDVIVPVCRKLGMLEYWKSDYTEVPQKAFRNDIKEQFRITLEVDSIVSEISSVDRNKSREQKQLLDDIKQYGEVAEIGDILAKMEIIMQQVDAPAKRRRAIIEAMDNLLKASGLRSSPPTREEALTSAICAGEDTTALEANIKKYDELGEIIHHTIEVQEELERVELEYLNIIRHKNTRKNLERIRKRFIEFITEKDRHYVIR